MRVRGSLWPRNNEGKSGRIYSQSRGTMWRLPGYERILVFNLQKQKRFRLTSYVETSLQGRKRRIKYES